MLPDYPQPPGGKNWAVQNIAGPASYSQIGIATPPTGGQDITAAQLGLTNIDCAWATCSDNGAHIPLIVFPSNPDGPVASIKLIWVLAATGAQVAGAVDLSARKVRITAVGN